MLLHDGLIKKAKSFIIQYSVDPKYSNLLDKISQFSVMKTDWRFLPDTEKPLKTILINKKSFKKIFSLINTNFLEFLSILEIVITKIRYEYFHSLLLTRSQLDPKLKRILHNIESYSMNGKTPISEYSIKKILHMAGFDNKDLPSFINLKKITSLSNNEEKLREKKIRRLSSRASILKMNDLVKDWENREFKKIGRDEISEKYEKQNLNEIDLQFKEVINKYNGLLQDIEKRKKVFNNELNNDNKIYVPIEDKNGIRNYIRKDYVNIIKDKIQNKKPRNKKNLKVTFKEPTDSSDTDDMYYQIKNCNNEIILIPKRKLENFSSIGDELISIQSNNDEPTLCPIPKIKEALNNWKGLNQIFNIPSRFPRNRWRKVQLKNMTFPNQEEINHLPKKDEIEDIIQKNKNDLLNSINNENNYLLEVNDGELVNSNVIDKVLNDKSEYDNFRVPNYLTKKSIDVSKKELEDLNNDEEKKYIKFTDKSNGKIRIVNKKELNDKLNDKLKGKYINMKDPIKLCNYKGKYFNVKPKDILIEKMDKNEKPYQPQKGEEVNKNLENELKNTIIFKQIGNFLVPQKLIDDIKNDKSEINEFEVPGIENYSDDYFNPESKIKISKNDIGKIEQFPEFVEVNYIDNNNEEKHNLINKNDLLKELSDNLKDEIKLKDFVGNDIETTKSNLIIVDNKNKENNYNKERSTKDYADEIIRKSHENKEYQLIPDENKKLNLFDKSYLNLILINNPRFKFDKYEIPNINKDTIKILKSDIEKIRKPKIYIKLCKENNLNEEYLIPISDLKNKHDEFSDENYLFTVYDKENKVPMKVKDLTVPFDPKHYVKLPPQPEEAISLMRNRFVDPQKDIDIIQVNDINDKPILVFKTEIEDKLEENEKSNNRIHHSHVNSLEDNKSKDNKSKSSFDGKNKSHKNSMNESSFLDEGENINTDENLNINKENNISNDIINPFENLHTENSLKSNNKEVIIENIDLSYSNIEKPIVLKDIHGFEKEIKKSTIPNPEKDNIEIDCMVLKGDEEILVNKNDLINLLIGEKSDIEPLISDFIKKKPKELDLLYREKKKIRPGSISQKFNRDFLNQFILPDDESLFGKNKKIRKKSNLDSIIEDKDDYEEDINNDEQNEKEKEKKIVKNINKKKSFEEKKKLLSGYNSAPDDDKIFEVFSDEDDDEEFKILFNKHHKKSNLFGINNENDNNKNNKKKNFERRETRSKSQITKKLDSGIEYMLSRRKDKDIYNIRWKIVKQIVSKKRKFKK